jgi:hypothetical protein
MRETCADFTDRAEDANFLARPFMLMIAALLARIFGKLEDMILLWRAGLIPPPAPTPVRARRTRARTARTYTRRPRANRRTPGLRPRKIGARRPTSIQRNAPTPRKPAPARRIDRYPKPPGNRENPRRLGTPISLRYHNK